jgi:formamidopyrimidine-DNA glycosylase
VRAKFSLAKGLKKHELVFSDQRTFGWLSVEELDGGVPTSAAHIALDPFDALYINVNGESGFFETSLNAYGQEGEPCPRCGRQIRRIAFTNRSSHFCPQCQRK